MKNSQLFDEQVERFHTQIVDLIKKYQFRDRNQVCCGLSVSQCYILESLHRHGRLTMKLLAEKMHLSVSTVTRVVEPLVKRGLVSREEDEEDRRIRLITMTESGEEAYRESWQNIYESEKMILENFPVENREMLIDFLKKLNKAVAHWQSCCSG
jgi:DNA-binding MarR family transcriptional regulator